MMIRDMNNKEKVCTPRYTIQEYTIRLIEKNQLGFFFFVFLFVIDASQQN